MLFAVLPVGNKIPSDPGCYIWDRYKFALHLPMYATYDDYGNFDIEDNDAYKAFKDMVSKHYVKDEDGIPVEELFGEELKYQDLMHDNNLRIDPVMTFYGEKSAPVMFMVIKRKVYDLMVEEFDSTFESQWNKDYVIESHTKIRETFAKLEIRDPDKKRLTKEEVKFRMEEIEKAPEIIREELTKNLFDEYLSMGFSWEYSQAVDNCMGPYSCANMTNYVIKLTAANPELHIGMRKFVSMLCELNIEINPQQYGSQDYDHLYHADLMTRIMVAGVHNDHDVEQAVEIVPKFDVLLDKDDVEYYTKPNWNNTCDLKRNETGELVASGDKYGIFNNVKLVTFKEV
ncbi:hypothetical protein phiAS5_ORF0317 [Aeromonas phage phiAS5]|uniref:Uncharacterized protein n=1 Tax=Aeromonas phage phiAS5 TaxID=879630 RepID=E1A271_9CAUD|nr:hypothetical protein phiAS5_ORF0317 [Aeromonas phage phiAS5]ADM80160.1 hypothetical protein phiAS5_ORF0317 [Aeromonas phage phiAS5]